VWSLAATARSRPAAYKRREPETTALHRIVRENTEPFLRYTREHYSKPLPDYVVRELQRYVGCGVLDRGFTRLRCKSCGARTICCSCAGRRMASASIHLTDRVLPDLPVRQFVLSVPYELRMLLASNSDVLSALIRIVMRVVLGFYRKRGRAAGAGSDHEMGR
jgi:hypothetical protein